MIPKSSDLKQMTRSVLRDKWGSCITITVVHLLITFGLTLILDIFSSADSFTGAVLYWSANVIISLISGLFSIGYLYYFLNICRDRNFQLNDLFAAFSMNPDRFLIVGIITSAANLILSLPIYLWVPTEENLYTYLLINFLLALLETVVSLFISLIFGLANYLLLDFPEMGAIESLRMSAKLMKGNKGRFFYLHLSFIGWAFVCIGTLFIGFLWLSPYMQMTVTYFYADVLERYESKQKAAAATPFTNHSDTSHVYSPVSENEDAYTEDTIAETSEIVENDSVVEDATVIEENLVIEETTEVENDMDTNFDKDFDY